MNNQDDFTVCYTCGFTMGQHHPVCHNHGKRA